MKPFLLRPAPSRPLQSIASTCKRFMAAWASVLCLVLLAMPAWGQTYTLSTRGGSGVVSDTDFATNQAQVEDGGGANKLRITVTQEPAPTSDITLEVIVSGPASVTPRRTRTGDDETRLTYFSEFVDQIGRVTNGWRFKLRSGQTSTYANINLQDSSQVIEGTLLLNLTLNTVDGSTITNVKTWNNIRVVDTDHGALVTPTTLEIDEGMQATYTVALSNEPSHDVTMAINAGSGAPTGSVVTTGPLIFTASNWDDLQTVTITSAQDDDNGIDEAFTITHAFTSTDGDYNNLSGSTDGSVRNPKVSVTFDDDDFVINLTSNKDEGGNLPGGGTYPAREVFDDANAATATDPRDVRLEFTVTTDVMPEAEITVAFAFETDIVDGGWSTFTEDSIRGATDFSGKTIAIATTTTSANINVNFSDGLARVEGTKTLTVTATATQVVGGETTTVNIPSVTFNVLDDDAGLVVAATNPVDTDEAGGHTYLEVDEGASDTYTIALSLPPTADVVVTLEPSGNAPAGSLVTTGPLTFTTTDWNMPKTVSVTGAQDNDNGISEVLTVRHSIASTDTGYHGLRGETTGDEAPYLHDPSAIVTFKDDEASLVISSDPTVNDNSRLVFTVTASSRPSSPITLDNFALSGSVQDIIDQDHQRVQRYSNNPIGGSGVVGGKRNTSLIIPGGSGSDPSSATFNINFTDGESRVEGTKLMIGTFDVTPDGNVAVSGNTVVVGTTTYLTHLTSPPVRVLDTDGGALIAPASVVVDEGANGTYEVLLSREPRDVDLAGTNVEVAINPGANAPADSLGTTSPLTFDAFNWEMPQTVTIAGTEDDDGIGGAFTIAHTITTDAIGYQSGSSGPSVDVVTRDNDAPTVSIGAPSDGVTEAASAMLVFTVSTNGSSYPITVPYTVAGGATAPATGGEDYTAPAEDAAITIPAEALTALLTVALLDDEVDEVNEQETVTVTLGNPTDDPGSDTAATRRSLAPVLASDTAMTSADGTIVDNDVAGVTFAPAAFNLRENGDGGEYTVVLGSQPLGDVTVTPNAPEGLTATPTMLTFTTTKDAAGGWNMAQTVTVSAGDDANTADDDLTISHAMTSATDTKYPALTDQNVVATVLDDDVGVVVSHSALRVDEDTVGSYTVQLRSRPAATVTVSVLRATSSTDPAMATLAPASLEFTTTNWNQPQPVRITAAADDADTDDETLTVSYSATSNDPQYHGARAIFVYQDGNGTDTDDTELTVTLVDDDVPRAVFSTTVLQLPPGESSTYTMHLAGPEAPTTNVTITASAPASSPVLVQNAAGTTSLVFTPSNYGTGQTLTVSGKPGVRPAANVAVTITHEASGSDAAYGTISVADVAVTVRGHVLLSIVDATADEDDGEMVFTASLNRAHTEDVTLGVGIAFPSNIGAETVAAPASAADFTASFVAATATISAGQTQTLVTVAITDDELPEGDEVFQLHLYGEDAQAHVDLDADNLTTSRPVVRNAGAPFGQRIPDLSASFPSTVSLYATGTITDDDRGAIISSTALSLAPGESPSYTVRLSGPAPTANVTVAASVPANSPAVVQGAAGTNLLVFTPSNYETAQTLTVSGRTGVKPVDDVTATITHEASGNDADYAAITVADVTVAVERHLALTIADAAASELGGEMVFTTRLNKTHAEDVTLSVGIVLLPENGATPASAADFSASFVAATATIAAGQTQTLVTVPIVNDGDAEGSETFQLHLYGEDVQRHAHPDAVNRTTARPMVRNDGALSGEQIPDLSATYGETITLYATGTIVDGVLPVVSVPETPLSIIPSADSGSYQAARFTVSIDTEPDEDLTLTPAPPQNAGLTVTPETLIFTDDNWATVRTLTLSVAGTEDADEVDNTVTVGWTKTGGGANYAPVVVADTQVVIWEPGSVAQVTGVTVESTPGDADKGYAVGETITVKVSFSRPIVVTGGPQLRLRIGGNTRLADLVGEVGDGGGSMDDAVDSLTFAYTIEADDVGAADVQTPSDGLFEGGGDALGEAEVPSAFLTFSLPDTALAPLFVDAGDDQEVDEQEAVTLEGSAAAGEQTLTYRWTQHEGNNITVELENADEATATFTAPNLAEPTTLTFILEATAGDDKASDEVRVEIDAVNEPPTASASANPSTVNGGETVTLTGTGSDPEGLTLGYAWSIREAAGQTITLDDPKEAITTFTAPTGLTQNVTLTFLLEVSDGVHKKSATTQVVVRGGDLSEVLGASLSRMGRVMAMSARDAVGTRLGLGGVAAAARRPAAGDLTVNGSRLGTTVNAWLHQWMPRSTQEAAREPARNGGASQGHIPSGTGPAAQGNAAAHGAPGGISQPAMIGRGTHQPTAADACGGGHAHPARTGCNHFAERALAGGPAHTPSLTPWDRYSNITSFEYALGFGLPSPGLPSGLLTDVSLWGQFDTRAFASEPTDTLTLEGSMTAFYVGVDKLYNGYDAAGIVLGLPSNTVDFNQGGVKGEVTLNMVNIHPYVSWSPDDGRFDVWGMLGFGAGESEVTTKSRGTQAADTSMTMFAGGGSLPLGVFYAPVLGDLHLTAKADTFTVSLSSDKTKALAEQSVYASQVRGVIEAHMAYAMSDVALLEPVLELGLRFDGGDGDTGMGMEMGIGAAFVNTAMGLSADGRARFLVFHGGDGVAESGFSLLLLYDPGSAGGLGVSFAPVWGETASQSDALWHTQDITGLALGYGQGGYGQGSYGQGGYGQGSHGASDREPKRDWRPERMDLSLHYGLERTDWMVTPYGSLVTGGNGREHVRLGLRLRALRLEPGAVRLNLFNESASGPGLEASLQMLLR